MNYRKRVKVGTLALILLTSVIFVYVAHSIDVEKQEESRELRDERSPKAGWEISGKSSDDIRLQTVFDTNIQSDRTTWLNANNTRRDTSRLYWPALEGAQLTYFSNTSAIIDAYFEDDFGEIIEGENKVTLPDRIIISPRGNEIRTDISSYYYPDLVNNDGFVVIFETSWYSFQFNLDGEIAFAKVDLNYTFFLPEGAALVSYAPEDAAVDKQGDRYVVSFNYIDREADPYHDPLTYEITYVFDDIFLKFADLSFQNLRQQQMIINEQQRTVNLSFTLRIIGILGILLSLLSILLSFILTKIQYNKQMKKAKELPRSLIKDIEETEGKTTPRIKSYFSLILLLFLIFNTSLLGLSIEIGSENTQEEVTGVEEKYLGVQGVSTVLEGREQLNVSEKWKGNINSQTNQINDTAGVDDGRDRINYTLSIQLERNLIATESVEIHFPKNYVEVNIWANTSTVHSFVPYTKNGQQLSYRTESDRFIISGINDDFIGYNVSWPYNVANNSGIYVYIDRFWLDYVNEDSTDSLDQYYNADVKVSITLPPDAFIYSASPSDLLIQRENVANRRKRIVFQDINREIDSRHNLFDFQISYAFENILDAIEKQTALFDNVQPQDQEFEREIVADVLQDAFFFSLIAIIAPIIAFLLSYLIFRKRALRNIEKEKQNYEKIIYVENEHIDAAKSVLTSNKQNKYWRIVVGSYYELIAKASEYVNKSLFSLSEDAVQSFAMPKLPDRVKADFVDLVREGREVKESSPESIAQNQGVSYMKRVNSFIFKLEREGKI